MRIADSEKNKLLLRKEKDRAKVDRKMNML
jgi:hypothetical protein